MSGSIWYRFYSHCIYPKIPFGVALTEVVYHKRKSAIIYFYPPYFCIFHFLVCTLQCSIYHSICYYQWCSTTFWGLSYNNIFLRYWNTYFLHSIIKWFSFSILMHISVSESQEYRFSGIIFFACVLSSIYNIYGLL